jgi:hypothetical protein
MTNNIKTLSMFIFVISFIASPTFAQEGPLGIFDDHGDRLGDLTPDNAKGNATYDPETGEYVIIGSRFEYESVGYLGYYVTSKFPTDSHIIIEATIKAENITEPFLPGCVTLTISESLQSNEKTEKSAYMSIGIATWNQSIFGYYRQTRNADNHTPGTTIFYNGRFKLIKDGNLVTSYFYDTENKTWKQYDKQEIDFNSSNITVSLTAGVIGEVAKFVRGRFTDVTLIVDGNTISDKSTSSTPCWNLYK